MCQLQRFVEAGWCRSLALPDEFGGDRGYRLDQQPNFDKGEGLQS